MDNEVNLDSLFEDAVKPDEPAEEPQEKPEETAKEPEKAEQDQAERSRQAMARRLREAEKRGAKAERERANALLAALDLDDPDNAGQKVSDLDKAAEYVARKRKERFDAGSPTEADIQHVVQEQIQRQTQPPAPQGVSAEDRAELDRQLAQIARMDPAMKDLGAILQSDIGPAFREYISKGDDFVTAFYKAGKLQSQAKEQAAAAEKAKANSKDHRSATKQRGTGALEVPKDVMAIYHQLMPGWSDADIQRSYNEDRKKYGPK